MINGYHCTRTYHCAHVGHNIDDPFAIAVYKGITTKPGLGHILYTLQFKWEKRFVKFMNFSSLRIPVHFVLISTYKVHFGFVKLFTVQDMCYLQPLKLQRIATVPH